MKYIKILLIVASLGAVTGFYLYNKPVKSTASKSADVSIQAADLFNEFANSEDVANKKYLDKVVSVKGTVTNIATEEGLYIVTLKTSSDMFGVICKVESGDEKVKSLKPGAEINVKGVCTGMLMDVVMVRCVIE